MKTIAAVCCVSLTLLIATLAVVLAPASGVASFEKVKSDWRSSDADLLDRHGDVLDTLRLDFGVRRLAWVRLDDLSPALLSAIVDGEDRKFWSHSGVDWIAVSAAAREQILPERRRGASTISMQVATLIDPRARAPKAWQRKLAQIRIARAIESGWTKREILEVYLNLLGFRGELQGIGASAQFLAGKAPSGLSLPESLALAALLPAPNASPDGVAARACARAVARRLNTQCEEIHRIVMPLLGGTSTSREHLAPQVARLFLKHPGEKVRTTIDLSAQRLASNVLSQHLSNLQSRNVRDGAVLIVENATGDVLAYVGSAGPQSRSREVDGVRARRQAGSTLKPFLYELAFERRYLTAASLLDDSPITLETSSGVYLPQNYDRDFKGLVSVRTALASSLNVPAVRTLVLVGVQPFRDRLSQLGYEGITHDGDYYGYSLALGSAEVSLWEQVQAYRALSQGGHWSPIHLTATAAQSKQAILSPAASFIVTDILSDRAARSLTFGLDNHLNTSFWSAVKTGTSKDMRDNWCVGFSSRYTVGVWVGNFEGDSMHDVSGVTGAAPVWSELMAALHAKIPSVAPQTPSGIIGVAARFSPAVEAPRREWFLYQTETPQVAAVSSQGALTRISSPARGMIIALDPDIPAAQQRVPFSALAASGSLVFSLDGQKLGSAEKTLLWPPQPGHHRLELMAASGDVKDHIDFWVR
jgi:penicillin-binding protein 1C